MTDTERPTPTLAQLERLARTELSFRARLAHMGLLLSASAMTVVVVSLWLTEPALPVRTSVAFGLLTMIGMGWAAYSAWVLRVRRVMLARQRVIAGRLAVAFAATFTIGCVVLGTTTTASAAWPALAMSLLLLLAACVIWRRAESGYRALLARRDVLERQVIGGRR